MKYEIDIESPNKVREWSRVPRVFNSIDELMEMVVIVLRWNAAIRIRKVEDDNT